MRLSPFIKSYLLFETDSEQSFTILPTNGMVVGFHYKGKMYVDEHGKERRLMTNGLFGMHDAAKKFTSAQGTGKIIVSFTAMGANAFFRFPLNEIFGNSYTLDNFIGCSRVSEVEEMLEEYSDDHEKKIGAIEGFLLALLGPEETDPLVRETIRLIKMAGGNLRIRELCAQLKVSQSNLEKRFRHSVGTSPKQYAMIVRMRSVINAIQKGGSLTEQAYDAGYFDQAHFIRDFKHFTGTTPRKYISGKTGYISL